MQLRIGEEAQAKRTACQSASKNTGALIRIDVIEPLVVENQTKVPGLRESIRASVGLNDEPRQNALAKVVCLVVRVLWREHPLGGPLEPLGLCTQSRHPQDVVPRVNHVATTFCNRLAVPQEPSHRPSRHG